MSPNPALDRTMIVRDFQAGEVNRASETVVAAGGKGLNVARVVQTLSGAAICAGPLGGRTGELVAELAESEGLRGEWTPIAGETRTCIIIVNAAGGEATVVNEPGPEVTPAEWERLAAQVLRASEAAACVCLSGSLPPGAPVAGYVALLRDLRDAHRTVWADTSGASLAAALEVGGVGVKVNGEEAGGVLRETIERPDQALDAARRLRERIGAPVVLTLGAQGAVLAGASGLWHARPPAIRPVSAVGSGDAFLGGLALALTQGLDELEALRHAVAAGAANTLSPGGGRLSRADFDTILAGTVA